MRTSNDLARALLLTQPNVRTHMLLNLVHDLIGVYERLTADGYVLAALDIPCSASGDIESRVEYLQEVARNV